MSELAIAAYENGIEGLTRLSDLTTPILTPPQAPFRPYAELNDLGNMTKLGVGWPSAEWRFPVLEVAELIQLRGFCPNASAPVYITTIDDIGTYQIYLATMVWPDDPPIIQAGQVKDLVIRFEGLEKMDMFQYQVLVADGEATTPIFTFGAGAPAAVVDWGDGTAMSAVTSGVTLNHVYTAGGSYDIKLIAPNQSTYLLEIDISEDKVLSVLSPIQGFQSLEVFYLYDNAAWSQDIGNWQLPPAMQDFEIYAYDVVAVTGDISHWVLPASLGTLFLDYLQVTGNVSLWVLPANLEYLSVLGTALSGNIGNWIFPATFYIYYGGQVSLSGVPILSNMIVFNAASINNCGLSQAEVDLWLSRLVAVSGSITYEFPGVILIDNAAPSNLGWADLDTLVAAGWTVTCSGEHPA
jgi:hypothetical protein